MTDVSDERRRSDLRRRLFETCVSVSNELELGLALHKALLDGRDLEAQWFLNFGACRNRPYGKKQYTPLHMAAKNRCINTLKALIAKGVNLEARTAKGSTALALAIKYKDDDAMHSLRAAGAKEPLPKHRKPPVPVKAVAETPSYKSFGKNGFFMKQLPAVKESAEGLGGTAPSAGAGSGP